ncbi:sensor histidine kinase [Pseudolysinimonas kribbensis]|nr:histidine kinase [Pseudolysinimonas kribbensis]
MLVGLALVGPLVLVAARRWPGPVVAITAVAAAADVIVNDSGGPPYIAFGFGIIGAIVRGARVWAWISILVAWTVTVAVAIVFPQTGFEGPRAVGTTLGILLAVAIGEALRTRRERYAAFRRRATEARQSELQAERVRIARELHDVLAHSLSQINVQAGVGLHLLQRQPDSPAAAEQAGQALASIKDTSKTALEEVRSVLGVLRAENGADPSAPLVPEPGLDRLGDLTVPGVRVELDDRLRHEEVPQPLQLAIFRIVQESLTNVGRHASGATVARVLLDRDDTGYRITVRDDGSGAASVDDVGSGGRGVLGMSERAELLGGSLTAGPAARGGFEVVAELPTRIGAA